jgi:hypothetical protein
MRTKILPESYLVGRSIGFNAIGGLVAGLVMTPLLMLTSIMAGLSANAAHLSLDS